MKITIKNLPESLKAIVILFKAPDGTFYFVDTIDKPLGYDEAVEKYGSLPGLCRVWVDDLR